MREKVKKIAKRANSATVLACLFVAFICVVGAARLPHVASELGALGRWREYTFEYFVETVDDIYAEMLTTSSDVPLLHNRGTYIELNGLIARTLGQRTMNDVTKLKNGLLFSFSGTMDVSVPIERMTQLFAAQEERGAQFLFVMAPLKVSKYDPQVPTGSVSVDNDSADELVNALRDNGVAVLDLRERMYEQGIDHGEAFYVTDHHWRTETALWAFAELMHEMTATGVIPHVDTPVTDVASYELRPSGVEFLGSRGRRTGRFFAGTDEMNLIIPRFDTQLTMEIPSRGIYNSGSFYDVAYDQELLTDADLYNNYAYSSIGYADNGLTLWRNDDALFDRRVMLIGDSFGNLPFALLSLVFSDCDEVDVRHLDEDFWSLYDATEPQLVIVFIGAASPNQKNTTLVSRAEG